MTVVPSGIESVNGPPIVTPDLVARAGGSLIISANANKTAPFCVASAGHKFSAAVAANQHPLGGVAFVVVHESLPDVGLSCASEAFQTACPNSSLTRLRGLPNPPRITATARHLCFREHRKNIFPSKSRLGFDSFGEGTVVKYARGAGSMQPTQSWPYVRKARS